MTTDHTPQHQREETSAKRRAPAKWLRVLVPALLILCWLSAASIGGPYFGKVSEVSSNDLTAYLPESADATRVQEQLVRFNDEDVIPAVVVFTSPEAFTDDAAEELSDAADDLTRIASVADDISPLIPSEDGQAFELFVPIDSNADVGDVVEQITAALQETVPDGVELFVTGPAGFSADLGEAFAGIDGILLLVALAAVLVILVLVYRSLLLPIAVLLTSTFALTVALLVVWWLAKAGVLLLSGQTQGILFILVIGAATDYSLLYVARYREQLRHEASTWVASVGALRGAFAAIVASGSTVIAGLLCLLLSDLKSNSTLGPVAAIGIVFAMLSALTLLPALLFVFGRAAFWPKRPKLESPETAVDDHSRGPWAALGRVIRRRPRVVWIVTLLVLIVAATGVTQLKAEGVAQSDLVLGSSQARDGQEALGEHFAAGSGSPVSVLTPENEMQSVADVLLGQQGIDGVSVLSSDSAAGTAQVTEDGVSAAGPPGTPEPDPTTVDGHVMLQGTLTDSADSATAADTVREIRSTLEGAQSDAIVGGVTATAIDTNEASIHDRNLIIPTVLIVIMIILMLLLRSFVTPLLLISTTVVSFGTALGISALVFNHVFEFPGADPAVPLYGFVFLVALGIDYNIFLATRVREETKLLGTREGIIRGLSVTGGVITSAGVVLAATFAALFVIPILFLAQIAFIVAFGVLLDTFIVRALLVPALMYDIGAPVWWPSRLAKGQPVAVGKHADPAALATTRE
ncbi:MAG: MMPL family transporter [Canibacter sp.]